MASKKASASSRGAGADRLGKRRGGEGTGGDDDAVPILGRQTRDFGAMDGDQGLGGKRRADRSGETFPVDGERAARRHAMGVGGAHDERAATPHLRVQQADGVVLGVVRAEGIGADELGEAVGDMRRGAAVWAHLHEHHRDAGARELPRRLASGQATADDMNGRGRLHQG